MNCKELLEMLDNGSKPVIEFTNTSRLDLDPDPGFRGYITGYYREAHDHEIIILTVSLSEFEDYNRPLAKPVWFNSNDIPSLTWFESGNYPKSGKIELYIDEQYSIEEYGFKLINEISVTVFDAYKNSKSELSYINWLEQSYLNHTK